MIELLDIPLLGVTVLLHEPAPNAPTAVPCLSIYWAVDKTAIAAPTTAAELETALGRIVSLIEIHNNT